MIHAPLPSPKTAQSSTNARSGFTIVEAMLSVTIFAMVVTACFGVFFYGQQLTYNAANKKHAVLLAKEGMEAMRAIRNEADALPSDGTYGLITEGPTWQLSETPDTPRTGFTRTITVETVDDYTKKVTVNIAWQQTTAQEGSFSIIGYLTPWTAVIDDTP